MKMGSVQSTKHTGAINFSIPFENISDSDFNENISISYNSSGFMPNKRGGIVGLGWHLNVGGAITRTVKGVPDEHKGNPETAGGQLNGFYYGVSRYPMTENNVYTFNSSTGHPEIDHFWERQPPGTPNTAAFESEPDLFRFNFHGITGTFFFNNQGGVEVIPNQKVNIEVDLTNFSEQIISHKSIPTDSEIIFKLDNGYTYYFGGEIKNLEFSIRVGSPNSPSNSYTVPSAVINTWNLTKVVSPSGKELIYEYEDNFIEERFTQFDYDEYPELETATANNIFRPIVINRYKNEYKNFDETVVSFFGSTFVGYSGGSGGFSTVYELLKQSYLKSISSENFFVEFTYRVKDNLFLNNTSDYITANSLYNFKDKRLGRINIFKKQQSNIHSGSQYRARQEINSISFEYDYFGNRMFLASVKEDGKPSHSFEYHRTNNLPSPETHSIDHWGFWKGGYGTTNQLIPEFISNKTTGDRIYNNPNTNDTRTPSGFCDVALLKKVTYPSSGYTEFIYEPHEYAKRLDRVSANDFLVSIEDMGTNVRAGGARIHQIIDFDGNQTTNTRTFHYNKNYSSTNNTSGVSSGILLNWPRYSYYMKLNVTGSNVSTLFRSKSSSFNVNAYDGFHMSYGEVTETYENGSYRTSHFSTHETHPDINDFNELNVEPLVPVSVGTVIPEKLYKNYVGQNYNDRSIERGKLIKEELFTNQNTIIAESSFVYNDDPNRFNNFTAQIHSSGGFYIQATKRYSYPNFLTQEISKTYSKNENINDFVQKIKTYDYNYDYHKLIKKETINSDGNIYTTEYKFPFDLACLSSTSENIYSYMVNTNLVRSPIEIISKKNNYVISAIYNSYIVNGNRVLLNESKLYRPTTTNQIYNEASVNSTFCNVILDPDLKTEVIYDRYNALGQIEQLHRKDGIPVTIIWGYNHTEVIAQIENATYDQVQNVIAHDTNGNSIHVMAALVEASNNDVTLYSGDDNEAQMIEIGALLRENLPHAYVTTYTYDPMIGVTSISDPTGTIVYSEYDELRRLKRIRDKDNNIISEKKYNYKSQN